MADQKKLSLKDLTEAAKGLGDQSKGPLVQGHNFGQGAFQAAVRQGAKELAQVLPAFPSSVRAVEEPGTIGNPTPQIVTEQLGKLSLDDLRSYAKDKAQEASQKMEKGQDKGMSM